MDRPQIGLIRRFGRNAITKDDVPLSDLLLAVAANIEDAMIEAGATPGGDYGMLDIFQMGVLSQNRRNFRHPSSSPATSASRSIILPSLWKV